MENVRDKVMQAAEALLREEGIFSLTLNRILAKAGVSKGGFFHHLATASMLQSGMAKVDQDTARLRESGLGETEAHLGGENSRPFQSKPLQQQGY